MAVVIGYMWTSDMMEQQSVTDRAAFEASK